jgi:hypothetical protein
MFYERGRFERPQGLASDWLTVVHLVMRLMFRRSPRLSSHQAYDFFWYLCVT